VTARGAQASTATQKPKERKQALRLWLRLLTASTMIEQQVRARLRQRFGVTLPQFDLLAALDKTGEALTMSELSQRLMVSNGNVTGVVDRLSRDGLVERWAKPSDRRVQYVRLTPQGQRAFDEMAREHESWIADMMSGLSGDEGRQFMDLLGRLKQSVENRTLRSIEE
jgi:DNA-binding MarR family transcriptional regulator